MDAEGGVHKKSRELSYFSEGELIKDMNGSLSESEVEVRMKYS